MSSEQPLVSPLSENTSCEQPSESTATPLSENTSSEQPLEESAATPLCEIMSSEQLLEPTATPLRESASSVQPSEPTATPLSETTSSVQPSEPTATPLSETTSSVQPSEPTATFLSKNMSGEQPSEPTVTPLSETTTSEQPLESAVTPLSENASSEQSLEESAITSLCEITSSEQLSEATATPLSESTNSEQPSEPAATPLCEITSSEQLLESATTPLSESASSEQPSQHGSIDIAEKLIFDLHQACRNGRLDIVKYLVEVQHCDPLCRNKNLSTPLHLAACNGMLDIVKYFIFDLHVNPILKCSLGKVPLHEAAYNGHLDVVKSLTKFKHCDDDLKDGAGRSPIHFASENGHLDIVKYFVQTVGIDPWSVSNDLSTPLHLAASSGKLNVVKYFVSLQNHNAKLEDVNGATPLHDAAINGRFEVVQFFVESKQINFNSKDKFGRVPLHYASQSGHLNVVKYLIQQGCDPLCVDNFQSTVLHTAAAYNHKNIFSYYEAILKIDLLQFDREGWTPLHTAAESGSFNIISFVYSSIQNLKFSSLVDVYGKTPLHLASQHGHLDIVKFIAERCHHQDLLCRDSGQSTPLHLAAYSGQFDVVKYFIVTCKISANVKDCRNRTPLHDAASNGHLKIVKILSLCDCDFSCIDKSGRSALHHAIENGWLEVVNYLANFKSAWINSDPLTLLHLFTSNGNLEMVKHCVTDLKFNPQVKKYGRTSLDLAASSGHLNVIRYFVEELNCFALEEENKALHLASQHGHLDVVKYLVEVRHCDPQCNDLNQAIPLHKAASSGNLEMVKYFTMTLSVDPQRTNKKGKNSLHLAASNGNLEIVQHFIETFESIDLNVQDNKGSTPLAKACFNGHKKTVELLLSHGAKDHDNTAYKVACDKHPELIDLLLFYDIKGNKDEIKKLLHCRLGPDTKYYLSDGHQVQLETIQVIHLESNQLCDVPIDLFRLRNVKEINLSDNNIVSLPYLSSTYTEKLVGFGWACSSLETLNLTSNNLSHIPPCVWVLPNLNQLYCSDNKLQEVVLAEGSEVTTSVKTINMSSNFLVEIPWFFFKLSYLQSLDLSFNYIAKLPKNLWEYDSLVDLNVSENQLSFFPLCEPFNSSLFRQEYEHVLPLNVHNSFKAKPIFSCQNIHKHREGHSSTVLSALDISNNKFTVLPMCLTFRAPSLKVLLVHGNFVRNINEYLHAMILSGKEDMVLSIIADLKIFNVNYCGYLGRTLLHIACSVGNLSLARKLVDDFGADPSIQDYQQNSALHLAVLYHQEELALELINQYKWDANVKGYLNRSLLHSPCSSSFIEKLVNEHIVDVNARDDKFNTPLHMAAFYGNEEAVFTFISKLKCDPKINGVLGRSLLHIACSGGCLSFVKCLISEYKCDVYARDEENNTPLHVAAMYGNEDIVEYLITEKKCDPTVKGYEERSFLHSACVEGHVQVVMKTCSYVTKFVVDCHGNTPLHTCAALRRTECAEVLLANGAPILIRNGAGKTPIDVAAGDAKLLLNDYMRTNKDNIYHDYDALQQIARKRYSGEELITRIFVIGNPGAGKSSLVETLKREKFLDSLQKVSQSSVPLHTAGIIPSIYKSKIYGRVLFYDFAGDPEYYSSHAAILENLTYSKKGDNIIIIVVDLTEEDVQVQRIINYWYSFVQNQKLEKKDCLFIIAGSHSDLLSSSRKAEKVRAVRKFCEKIQSEDCCQILYFSVHCCKPKSQSIRRIKNQIHSHTKDSTRYNLTFQAVLLLGLLERDFKHVVSCSIHTLISHIEDTGIDLPSEPQSLYCVLKELHDIGLFFVIMGESASDLQIVLNISQLTNKVHQLLFSKNAMDALKQNTPGSPSHKVGIISEATLREFLPEYITRECLIQLQYCQEIQHEDITTFPITNMSDSTKQSFLFFPALCTAQKDEVSLCSPQDMKHSIGWLAQCSDPQKCFPQRFLHVLLLRLVFRFTLSAPHSQTLVKSADPSHCFHPRCTMWTTGVHWLMEEGVECMVELINFSQSVAVVAKGCDEENFTDVFDEIITLVSSTIKDYCHNLAYGEFLLDATDDVDYLNEDNMFSLSDLHKMLECPKKVCAVSKSGKKMSLRVFNIYKKVVDHRKAQIPDAQPANGGDNGTVTESNSSAVGKISSADALIPHQKSQSSADKPSMSQLVNLKVIKKVANDWTKIGYCLRLPDYVLDNIRHDTANFGCEQSSHETFRRWLGGEGLQPTTWRVLIEALQDAERGTLAADLQKHITS